MGSRRVRREPTGLLNWGGCLGWVWDPAVGIWWVASPACLEMKAGNEQSMLGSPVVSRRWDSTIKECGPGIERSKWARRHAFHSLVLSPSAGPEFSSWEDDTGKADPQVWGNQVVSRCLRVGPRDSIKRFAFSFPGMWTQGQSKPAHSLT